MPQGVRVRVSPGRLIWVCGGILVCTSDLRSDAVRIESSNLSRPIIKEIMQFERVTSRNWYTHFDRKSNALWLVGSSPTNTLSLILISFLFWGYAAIGETGRS